MSLCRYESSHHGYNAVSTPSGVLKAERITKLLRALVSYTSTTSATGHGDTHAHTKSLGASLKENSQGVQQEACSLLNINGLCLEGDGGLPQ